MVGAAIFWFSLKALIPSGMDLSSYVVGNPGIARREDPFCPLLRARAAVPDEVPYDDMRSTSIPEDSTGRLDVRNQSEQFRRMRNSLIERANKIHHWDDASVGFFISRKNRLDLRVQTRLAADRERSGRLSY